MPQCKVTASSLNVRQVPSLQGVIIGALAQNDIVEQLDTSEDQKWLHVQKAGLVGWSSQKYLTPLAATVPTGQLDQIIQLATSSSIATYHWPERGIAPRGYIKGMALVFARVYCKLLGGNAYAVEMAKANTGDSSKDALSHYANHFDQLGMDNEASSAVTLRHLFVLLLGLGMRESSGRWCEGRDMSADNTTSETAEAGLFQTSWSARSASPLLPQLFSDYHADPADFLDVFREGVTEKQQDLENFGSGDGSEFQKLSKECPAFAAEFAAIGLRNIRTHWGPVNSHAAELRPEADLLFLHVQQAVDVFGLCAKEEARSMPNYRVTASSLNVREEPKLTATVIGFLSLDETVEGISISGDGYWYKIRRTDGLEGWSSHKFLVEYQGEIEGEEFPWMPIALQEVGVKEYAGAADHPRIVEYLSSTNLGPSDRSNDETPWCSAFVNWSVQKAGYEGTDSAWAKSWLTWGKELAIPRRGCIAVFTRGEGGHVGFYMSKTSSVVKILGGNQSDEVNISSRPASKLLGYRIPANADAGGAGTGTGAGAPTAGTFPWSTSVVAVPGLTDNASFLATMLNFAETANRNFNFGQAGATVVDASGKPIDVAFNVDSGYWVQDDKTFEPWLFNRPLAFYELGSLSKLEKWLQVGRDAETFYNANINLTGAAKGFFQPKVLDGEHDAKYCYVLPNQTQELATAIRDAYRADRPANYTSAEAWTEREIGLALECELAYYLRWSSAEGLARCRALAANWSAVCAEAGAGAPLHTLHQHGEEDTAPWATRKMTSSWMAAIYFRGARKLYGLTGDTNLLHQVSDYVDFAGQYGFVDGGAAHPELQGLSLPFYLYGKDYFDGTYADTGWTGQTNAYTRETPSESDFVHSLDILGLYAFGLRAKTILGKDVAATTARMASLRLSVRWAFNNWTRTATHLPMYRISPPRQFNWWMHGLNELFMNGQ